MSNHAVEELESSQITSVAEHASGTEFDFISFRWLCPLLKEYTHKLEGMIQSLTLLFEKQQRAGWFNSAITLSEAARLISLHGTLNKPIADLVRVASGLIEQSTLGNEPKLELKIRTHELVEHINFAKYIVDDFVESLKQSGEIDKVRTIIEQSGRYKAQI